MRQYIAILFALLFTFSCAAQKRIPREIRKAQELYEQRLQSQRSFSDTIVELSPIENIPDLEKKKGFLGLFNVQNQGNWGYNYLETDKWENYIRANASRRVVAFVFDTGIDRDHENLRDIILTGKDFTSKGDWDDGHGHGTHVAGTIAGKANGSNEVGIGKVLREKNLIGLVAVKVLTDQGSGSYTGIANGLKWANELAKTYIDRGDFVVYNFSLGGGGRSTTIDAELKKAEDLGVLISYASNGNTGRESFNYPGGSEYTEGIAAIESNGKRASFSTIADYTRFAFPGVSIYSCLPKEIAESGYGRFSGTSMSSPHGAGTAAVVASVRSELSASQIKKLFESASTDLDVPGWDKNTGFGVTKFTQLFGEDTPPEDPEPPEEPKPEPPTDPEPPEEPEQPAEPEQTDVFDIEQPVRILWSTMADPNNRKTTYVKFQVKYTHNEIKEQAGKDIAKITADFFKRRGFVLASHHKVKDAIYYGAFFYQMLLEREGIEVEVVGAKADFDAWWCSDYLPGARNRSAQWLSRKNILTYQW